MSKPTRSGRPNACNAERARQRPLRKSAARGPAPRAGAKAALNVSTDNAKGSQISSCLAGALFSPWKNARKILLAVSGGPDSIALMLLAAEWAQNSAPYPGEPRLHVATVDHGLRANARAEAEKVAGWAARLGLPHDILVWDGAKPRSKIQELAREARYELLFSFAARIGAQVVATAHHADDQAETILFRLLRGSGLGGLAGMAANVERRELIHARPLLQFSKAELRAYCAAKGHPFCVDPSNSDPAYARTRMRALCGLLAKEGLGRDALLRLGRRAARAEAALADQAQAAAAGLSPAREPGGFVADISCLAAAPEEIFLRVIAREIDALGFPDSAAAARKARGFGAGLAARFAARRALRRHARGDRSEASPRPNVDDQDRKSAPARPRRRAQNNCRPLGAARNLPSRQRSPWQ